MLWCLSLIHIWLEAGASYRLSFGYSDVPRYKLSGKFSGTGITGEGTAEEPVANE